MDLPSATRENLELLTKFDDRAQAGISRAQRIIERISTLLGSPTYFVFSVVFIVAWVLVNQWGMRSGWQHVDPPPYAWLQGIVSSNALLLTIAVLIRQNRMAQLAEHRSHLDLQINLLTEQKVTKILELVNELRRKGVQNLHGEGPESPQAPMREMTKPTDPHAILDAIKEQRGDSKP